MIESSNDAFLKTYPCQYDCICLTPINMTIPEDICKKDVLITEALGEYLMVFQWTMSLQLDGEILLDHRIVYQWNILSFIIF